jgi:hypothetical protein
MLKYGLKYKANFITQCCRSQNVTIDPFGKHVTLTIQPRFRVRKHKLKAQHLDYENKTL